MTTQINRQWLFKARPTGPVGPEHFEWREGQVPTPGPGQVLVRNKMLSLDPANRAWMDGPTYRGQLMPGQVMDGFAIGEVVQSNAANFAVGDIVDGVLGWQDYVALRGGELTKRDKRYSPEMLIGVLGVTGLTAYFGLLDVGRPRPGETVLVSGAGGAVGSIVGQIAKLMGCRVIGTAGGADKCAWLTRELGFDAAIDYKQGNLRAALKEASPNGIDVYFDNTGGEVLDVALFRMNLRGRIVCCGNVSQYDAAKPAPGPAAVPGLVVVKRLRLEGFVIMDYFHERAKAEAALAGWVREGKIKSTEDIVDGLENAPAALAGMFKGRNKGKLAVRVAK